jgi:hypothetical protein
MELRGLGGAGFDAALGRLRAGEAVRYRGMDLVLHATELECRVPADASDPSSTGRALSALIGARFRLGALLASAAPLDALVGNRPHRLVLVRSIEGEGESEELFELRGDRLRRLGADAP